MKKLLFVMNYLPLSFIAEFEYCPRSAYYLITDAPKLRDENNFIQDGRELHQKVDDGYKFSKKTKKVESSIRIFSEKYFISGKIDIVEFHENNIIIPVELKRGKTRESSMHSIQIALSAICLKEIFPNAKIENGAIFFCEDRQKIEIILTDELIKKAQDIALFLKEKNSKALNPKDFPALKDSRCLGCCFYQLCYF